MNYCQGCGNKLQPNDQFCQSCGQALVVQTINLSARQKGDPFIGCLIQVGFALGLACLFLFILFVLVLVVG